MFANSVNHKPKSQDPDLLLHDADANGDLAGAAITLHHHHCAPDLLLPRSVHSACTRIRGVTRDLVPWGKEDTTRCRGSSRRGGCKRRRAYISSPLRRRSGVRWTGLAVSYSRRLLYDGRLRAAGGERLLSLGHSSRSRRYAHTSTQQQKGQHVKRFYIALIKGLNATCVLK